MKQKPHPRNGFSVRELASKTGVSTSSITRWTSEPREAYLGRAAERGEQIQQLHSQGLTMREISAEVGCGLGTVHRWVKRLEDS